MCNTDGGTFFTSPSNKKPRKVQSKVPIYQVLSSLQRQKCLVWSFSADVFLFSMKYPYFFAHLCWSNLVFIVWKYLLFCLVFSLSAEEGFSHSRWWRHRRREKLQIFFLPNKAESAGGGREEIRGRDEFFCGPAFSLQHQAEASMRARAQIDNSTSACETWWWVEESCSLHAVGRRRAYRKKNKA